MPVSVWAVVAAHRASCIRALLSLTGSRTPRVVGVGSQEYRAHRPLVLHGIHLGRAGRLRLPARPGCTSSCRRPRSRTMGLSSQPLAVATLARGPARHGRMSNRVLLVGSEASIAPTARDLKRTPAAGLHVVGACTPTGRVGGYIPGTDIAGVGFGLQRHPGSRPRRRRHRADQQRQRAELRHRSSAELGARARPAPPDRRAEPHRHRRSAPAHPARGGTAAGARRDSALPRRQAVRQAGVRRRRGRTAHPAALAVLLAWGSP